mmetsp:Transcript_5645/g.22192  ORF Transcript_5645/g.22192 Transcript_5645/m.22192 type:complete len:193 (+) Transcript_5645:34-612(+)
MAAVDAEEALEAHAEAFQDAFAGVSETIENLIRNNTVAPQTFAEHVEAFLTAIDFEEPFIRALLSVHIVLLVTLWLLRKSHTAQTALFIVICVLIGSAEQLNRWASKNWRQFATQNYFDEHGVFAGVMFCGPLLCLGFAQLIGFLSTASTLLIKVKRAELRRQRREQASAGESAGEAAVASAGGQSASESTG